MANRLLTINIRNYLVNQPRRKRPMRISNWVKFRIAQSTNVRTDNIKISRELNTLIMKEHLHSMKKLKVNISIDKEIATVTPFAPKQAAAVAAKPVDAKAKPSAAAPAAKPAAVTQPKQPAQKAAPAPKKETVTKTTTDAESSTV